MFYYSETTHLHDLVG